MVISFLRQNIKPKLRNIFQQHNKYFLFLTKITCNFVKPNQIKYDMSKKMNISDNIRMLREKLNYSQEYVASKLNMTQQAYSAIEKHPEKTSLINLRQIARVLNVNITTLILEDDYFVQQNFNQQHCNIASQQHITANEIYERLIAKLENEVDYLRKCLDEKDIITST